MQLANGHTYEEVDASAKEKYQRNFPGFMNDMIVLQPGGMVVPRRYLQFQQKIFDFKFRPGDVVIMTYPKSGTTWMQEILWTMLNNPNLDNEAATNIHLGIRSPYIEGDMLDIFDAFIKSESEEAQKIKETFRQLCPGKNIDDGFLIQIGETQPGRRVLKTHFPFSMQPSDLLSTAKVVFVARNPKDVCLSWQHLQRLNKSHSFAGTQDTFVDYFVNGRLLYGSFAKMLKETWALRDHPNMHFIFYEDLKEDIDGELRKINDFIGTGLSDQQLKNVKEVSSFSSMKTRDTAKDSGTSVVINEEVLKKDGGYVRKGQRGGWKENMTPEQAAKIDDYVKQHFEGTGLTFKY